MEFVLRIFGRGICSALALAPFHALWSVVEKVAVFRAVSSRTVERLMGNGWGRSNVAGETGSFPMKCVCAFFFLKLNNKVIYGVFCHFNFVDFLQTR